MAKLSAKVAARITTHLKKYQSILSGLQKRDVSEADTVTVINDMLSEICGYDKYLHVTSQYAIRGTYVDLAGRGSNCRSDRRRVSLPTQSSRHIVIEVLS
jgi:hypothetical protein